jgi:hypothetical protein
VTQDILITANLNNMFDTPTQATWADQVTFMKTWLQQRAVWIDSQWK